MSRRGAFFSPGKKPFFSFGRKKEAEPELEAKEGQSGAVSQDAPPAAAAASPDFSTRTIGGVPMDWPDEASLADEPGAWQPSPSVPWASSASNLPETPAPSAVFEPQSTDPALAWGDGSVESWNQESKARESLAAPIHEVPFAMEGSPLPEGRDPVAMFQPDGELHKLTSVTGQTSDTSAEPAALRFASEGGAAFTPQPIRSQPPAPEPAAPFELQLVQGTKPVIPDWEPGVPVPIDNEPKVDSCLPTSDPVQTGPIQSDSESTFTWDQVLAPAPEVRKPEESVLPGIAADLSAATPVEPVKTTPPPAWGAPAWGRPRLAREPEVQMAQDPEPQVPQVAESTEAHLSGQVSEPDDIASPETTDLSAPFDWPAVESEKSADFFPESNVAAELSAAEEQPAPFVWPSPVVEAVEDFAPVDGISDSLPPVLGQSEPIAWPDPVVEEVEDFAPLDNVSDSLPPVVTQSEPIAWPDPVVDQAVDFAPLESVSDSLPPVVSQSEPLAWPSHEVEKSEAIEATSELTESEAEQPPASTFSWPEPVMELPPISVLEAEVDDLAPQILAEQEPLAAAIPPPIIEPPLHHEMASHVAEPHSPELDLPESWGGAAVPEQEQQPEAPSNIGQWQEEEPSQEVDSGQTETSATWGLPSTWMREAPVKPADESEVDNRWVSAEEDEQPAPAAAPAVPAAPTIDPEIEIEKSLERLFSLNRSFRWKRVGELLEELGLVSDADLAEALKHQKETKRPLGKTLVEMGIISDRLLLKVLAAQKDVIPWYFDDALEPDLLALLEPEFCLRCQVLPVRQQGATLTLVMRNPSDVDTIDFVQHSTGLRVEPALGEEETLAKKIEEGYSRDARSHRAHVDALVQEAFKSSDIRVSNIEEGKSATAIEEETRPVSAIVQKLIAEAIKMRASDIHMEPTMHDLQVRYRIDGRLHKVNSVPKEIQPMIAARVKIMAELDPVEWRIPQDGRISFEIDRRVVDLRVSVLPSFYGSRIVMRLLDRSAGVKNLDDIGFSTNNLSIFKTLIKRPYGLFLVTGPTGSGKTTSLYAALNEVKDEETNIITCEDPVEYNLDGISQSQVNTKIGLTFAAQLRSILRQDPDVVLVGEIRDQETAETAIRASMTGHLVFSTLHCNDAPSAIPRLLDMNIDPFLLSTSLIGVMGQRLIRRICPDCGAPYKPSQDETTILERTFGLVGVDKLYKGTGCVRCAHTGFKGRFAVHEIMPVTQEISSYIADRASTEKLGEVSRFYGYRTMQEDTLERVLAGQTTLKEAQRLLAFDDIPRIEPGSKKK